MTISSNLKGCPSKPISIVPKTVDSLKSNCRELKHRELKHKFSCLVNYLIISNEYKSNHLKLQ